MTDSVQGTPCWYELMTPDLAAAEKFYSGLIGWQIADSGMEGMTYHLAKMGETMVAGMMAPFEPNMPCFWMIYFATDSADATAAACAKAGGKVYRAPADIPGVGRFAILGDPQGAGFGILQPNPGGQGGAFDQQKMGHGNWHELHCPDPAAAMDFYGKLFGWGESRRMPMGEMGDYHIFNHAGADIGGMMRLMSESPTSYWLPYFGITGADRAVEVLGKTGGKVLHGPAEVPGGAWIVQATDPQGIAFAVVGPK